MASNTKIDEIIDDKAFAEWERFVDSLQKGQSEMAKMVSEANALNKSLGGSSSIKTFNEEVTKLAESLGKVEKAREKTIEVEKKLEVTFSQVSQAAEKAARKEIERSNAQQKAVSDVAERLANATDVVTNAYKSQNRTLGEAVQNVLELKKELSDMKKEQKAAGDALKPEQLQAYSVRMAQLQNAIQQGNTEIRQFAKANISAKGSLVEMEAELARLRGVYASLSAEEREAGQGADVLAASIVELDQKTKELRKTMGQHQAEVGNYGLIWDKVPGPIRHVVETLNRLGLAQKAQSAATQTSIGFQRQADRQNDKTQESVNDVTNALNRSTAATNTNAAAERTSIGFKRVVVEANEKAATAIEATAEATEAAGEAGEKVTFGNMVAGLRALTAQALAFIATPIGAAIAAIGATLAGAKVWFDYNKGLEQATRLTQQLTGTTGDEAKQVRDEISATADVFNVEFNDTLRAANALSKEFGISFSEASDLINKGFVKGANASGQFLEDLKEYSVQLKAAGLSAEDTIAILARSRAVE